MSLTTKEYGDVYWSEDIHTTNCIMFRCHCHLFHFAYIHMYRSSPPIVYFNLLAVSHITSKNEPTSRKNLSTTGVNSCHFRFMNSRCAPKDNLLHLCLYGISSSRWFGDLGPKKIMWSSTVSTGVRCQGLWWITPLRAVLHEHVSTQTFGSFCVSWHWHFSGRCYSQRNSPQILNPININYCSFIVNKQTWLFPCTSYLHQSELIRVGIYDYILQPWGLHTRCVYEKVCQEGMFMCVR